MKQNKSIWEKLKDKSLSWGLSSMLGLSVIGGWLRSAYSVTKTENKTEVVKDSLSAIKQVRVKNPVRNVEYRTDTLERVTSILMYYQFGSITRNYVENNNSYRLQLPYLAHEDWHGHNDAIHYRNKFYFTPIEYYKLCMHDEISATIVGLLTARYEYLAASTKAEKRAIIQKYKSPYFKFYFDAVVKGKIKPQSTQKADFDKEMSFIANGTKDMWMKNFSATYSQRSYDMLRRFIKRMGLVENSKANYNFVLNYMYTIGGVNFAEYMKTDINTTDDKVKLVEQLRKVKSMREGGLEFINYVNASRGILDEISLQNKHKAFQDLLISSQLKSMLKNKTAETLQKNPQLVNLCFVKIMNKIRTDEKFKKLVLNYPLITANSVNLNADGNDDADKIRQMYNFKGVDLLSMISSYKSEAMPVIVDDKFEFKNYSTSYISAMEQEYMEKKLEANKKPNYPVSKSSAEKQQATGKKRLSAPQYIVLPNFREPILTAASAGDRLKILACIREFEQIPQVLKGCNTQAQRRYFEEHPEIVSKYMQMQKQK